MNSEYKCDFNKIEILKRHVRSYPDFPKTGVLFRDIFGLLHDPSKFLLLREVLVDTIRQNAPDVECIAALDARGFLIGPIAALDLKVPFVAIRKKGKLPGNVISQEYSLEYGTDTLEVQTEYIKNDMKIVLIDDVLATGGSLKTSCELIEKCNAKVLACVVVIELEALNGISKISVPVHSLLKY